ncbi:MAG: hypothetical protein WBD76_08105, partial [Methyloceanibacter sp.]
PSSIRPPANHKENGITPPRPDQAPTKSTKSALSGLFVGGSLHLRYRGQSEHPAMVQLMPFYEYTA